MPVTTPGSHGEYVPGWSRFNGHDTAGRTPVQAGQGRRSQDGGAVLLRPKAFGGRRTAARTWWQQRNRRSGAAIQQAQRVAAGPVREDPDALPLFVRRGLGVTIFLFVFCVDGFVLLLGR